MAKSFRNEFISVTSFLLDTSPYFPDKSKCSLANRNLSSVFSFVKIFQQIFFSRNSIRGFEEVIFCQYDYPSNNIWASLLKSATRFFCLFLVKALYTKRKDLHKTFAVSRNDFPWLEQLLSFLQINDSFLPFSSKYFLIFI